MPAYARRALWRPHVSIPDFMVKSLILAHPPEFHEAPLFLQNNLASVYDQGVPDTETNLTNSEAPLHVVAAVIISNSRVLVGRRASHKSSPGEWEFPGGKVEEGESTHQALAREISEELGLLAVPIRTFDISVTEVNGRKIKLESILSRVNVEKGINSSDHDRIEWLTLAELAKLPLAAPDKPVFEKLLATHELDALT